MQEGEGRIEQGFSHHFSKLLYIEQCNVNLQGSWQCYGQLFTDRGNQLCQTLSSQFSSNHDLRRGSATHRLKSVDCGWMIVDREYSSVFPTLAPVFPCSLFCWAHPSSQHSSEQRAGAGQVNRQMMWGSRGVTWKGQRTMLLGGVMLRRQRTLPCWGWAEDTTVGRGGGCCERGQRTLLGGDRDQYCVCGRSWDPLYINFENLEQKKR